MALLTLGLIVILLLQEDQVDDNPEYLGNDINRPYATLKNGKIIQYDESGTAAVTLHMQAARYYEQSDAIEIERPLMQLKDAKAGDIQITAETGSYQPKAQILELDGSVLVHQTDSAQTPLQIKTEALLLDNRQRFISTDSAVTIAGGAQQLSAVGMRADLDARRVELLSNVKGRYELEASK
ncbi:MAG: LPS export ABC transporter periplasmic protein LptC [Oleiphilaceae bacterium]|nr:LPS export ABC transporter periplasmic protein LptC [Oleiphilaceae bacterium]